MSSRPPSASAIAEEPIGADRELALIHTPPAARGALGALYQVDAAMGDVVAKATDPDLARIKLAWWREQLEALDTGPPPAEPRLRAIAELVVPTGVKGGDVAGLEPGWATLLDPEPDAGLVAARGRDLFRIGATLLGADDPKLDEAGALHALASVGRRGLPDLLEPARRHRESIRGHRFARGVRPLTMLARAAARDLDLAESEWGKARGLAMLRHRWTGLIG